MVAWFLSSVLPRPDSLVTGAIWMLAIVGLATVALVGLRRAAQRLLPLAALLNIALLFPDAAPSRFAVARMRGSPTELQHRLRAATEDGPSDDLSRLQTITQLVLALSVHDRATRGHSERVRVFTELIADEMKISEPDRARLRWAAILHDIGKLEVPASTLNKSTKPTEDEWVALHHHPEEGARLVGPLLPWLAEWGSAVAQHHERFDGTGYPHGLRGEEISLAARIVAAADSYEVMTAPRSYKKPMGVVAARQEMVRVAGSQLDPAVVRAFLNISLGQLWRTVGLAAWVAQFPMLGPLLPRLGALTSGGATAAAGMSAALVFSTFGGSPVTGGVLALSTSPGVSAPTPGQLPEPADVPHHGSGTMTAPPGVGPAFAGGLSNGSTSTAAGSPSAEASSGASTGHAPNPAGAGAGGSAGQGGGNGSSTPPAPASDSSGGNGGGKQAPPPWSCSGCTNTAASCTNHCAANNSSTCTAYCAGNHNTSCRMYCDGNNDQRCAAYCRGNHDVSCAAYCDGKP